MFHQLTQSVCILTLSLSLLFPGENLSVPAHKNDDSIVIYPGYILEYNETYEQATWVAYELTAEEVYSTKASRNDNFMEDPNIKTGSAIDSDYRKSGFDRGHLAPAADMKFSTEAMNACFYYSNMSPQNPSFNRGVWSKLEAIVRFWAVENDAVLVVTGPVLNKPDYPTIGENEVAVPEFYYKVVLDYCAPVKKGIAFIIPNEKGMKPLSSFAMTIDEAELITGLDFFPLLPDSDETLLESNTNLTEWPLTEFSPKNTQKKDFP